MSQESDPANRSCSSRLGQQEAAATPAQGDDVDKMAAPAELCCLECFPAHLGPLDVLLAASRFPSLFQDDNDPPTVLFRPQRPQGSALPALLLRVHPTAEEGSAARSRGRVRLYTSRLFMRFHRLGGLDTTGTVRAAKPVQLERVVLGARSRPSLRGAAGHLIGRLHHLCPRSQPLLARRGEPLLLPLAPGEEPEQVGGVRVGVRFRKRGSGAGKKAIMVNKSPDRPLTRAGFLRVT